MSEVVLITGVDEEDTMDVELRTEQEEQTNDCSKEVKDDRDGCGTKEVIRWEKFLPRVVLRVLLVEADDSTRQIIAALLRKCCYRVAAVADGLKAWETLKRNADDIDLILTEVELPSISGFALLSLVMEHDICKNIPVIMMSSQDSISTALKCMLKGAADFLIKPVRRNELRNLWQHVWRRHTQKVEATSENVAASSHSGDCVTDYQNKRCNDKGRDIQGLFHLISKSASNLSNGGVQRNEKSTILDKEIDMRDSLVGEEGAVCNEALNLKSMEAEEDQGSVKTVIQDKLVTPECSREDAIASVQACDCDNEVTEPSRTAVDLIGTFDQALRTTGGNFRFDDQRNKFNLIPQLELSLRNGPSELNQQPTDERQTLNHSNASAFSWYCSKPLHCISSLYPEGSAKGNSSDHHVLRSHEPKQSDQGQVAPSMFCQDSVVRWSDNQVCHPENSAFSPNASFLADDAHNHGSEQGYHWSADAARNPIILEPVHDLKNLVPKEEVRLGSPSADQSVSTDAANRNNGSSYGSMGSGSDGNEISAIAAASARGSFDDGRCSIHDGVRTDSLRTMQREAALTKFRLKRKDRCFEKKVRYQSRKRLAEQRPRMKGQFVRQAHTDPISS